MIEKQTKALTPAKLRIVLLGLIVVTLIGSGFGFWLFRNQMTTYAESVNEDARSATVSSNDITMLQSLQAQLEENSVAVTRAKNIVADSKSYQYQNQIISDINTYAKAAGVGIAGYGFNSEGSGAAAASGTAAPAAPLPAAPSGLKTTSVSVTITNPVSYRAIIRFIHSIELNLTKMQLSGVTLTKSDTNSDEVTVGPLTIEVYVR